MNDTVVVINAAIFVRVTIDFLGLGSLLKGDYLRECWTITFDDHTWRELVVPLNETFIMHF
jgi:hypothetical protein